MCSESLDNTMNILKERKVKIIIAAIALYIAAFFIPKSSPWDMVLFAVPYATMAFDYFKEIVFKVFKIESKKESCECGDSSCGCRDSGNECGKSSCGCACHEDEDFSIFDENFLMVVASLGAFFMHEYLEAIAVLILFTIGELFEDRAVEKSRKNIEELMDIRPDYANILDDGELIKVDPRNLRVGAIIYVRAGEKIPLDGVIVSGSGLLNTSALTGESVAREVKEGDEVLSGSVNISLSNREILEGSTAGTLAIRTTSLFGDSTASKILDLVQNASEKKSKSEAFITKFARVYTPFVCALALTLAIIPSIITGDYMTWIYRACTFLVISCPCALVISIPLSFFAGIGGASNSGILIKGSNYMETLSKVSYVAFDKTGTITEGRVDGTDRVKTTSKEAISSLKKLGIRYTIMLTGDYKEIAESIANEVGIDIVYSNLLPEDKLGKVEELLSEKKPDEKVCYVGDGVNDAPVLMRADLGIAMGALGSDAAVEAADVVLMDDNPLKVAKAIKIARKCMRIVKENIAFAIGIKIACLVLGALGIANMWMAIFADVGVMVIAVLNAIRALRVKNI